MFEKMLQSKVFTKLVSETALTYLSDWRHFDHAYCVKKGEHLAEMEKLDRELSERKLTAEKELAVKEAQTKLLEAQNERELVATKKIVEEKEGVIGDLRDQVKFLLTKLDTSHSHCPAKQVIEKSAFRVQESE